MQTYAALKKAEKMEAELKNFLIANYGFNAWNDVLRIQGELRKARLAEKRRREKQLEDAMTYISIVILTGLIGGLLFFIGYLIFGT